MTTLSTEETHQPEHIMIDQVKNKQDPADVCTFGQPLVAPTSETIQTLLDNANVSGMSYLLLRYSTLVVIAH